ncbi:MAG: phosphate ABC transporter substrate-binding protein [Cellvibrionaceae bacterium]|nr:phosphate ABC transporter substrate-binding protein [Cellvibrionaceae bacterium]
MKKVLSTTVVVLATFFSATALSEVAVVVHPSNDNALTKADVTRIFLGKKRAYPNGSEAIPVDQTDGSAVRTEFVHTMLKKNDQQLKAYWAQLLFTGKSTPPKDVGGSAEVKALIAKNPALIGYIDANQLDDSVRVVLRF